jgi:hypothetical protein
MQSRPFTAGSGRPELNRISARSRRRLLRLATLGLAALATLSAGCARPPTPDAAFPRQLAELGCIGNCQGVRDRCNADARYDYRQCQAGYSESFSDYRRCLATELDRSRCGYPWWSCAENLYGYCANRAAECEQACRSPAAARPPENLSAR